MRLRRDAAALEHHYAVERELAARLREAPRESRGAMYHEVYAELFRRVPDHPQLGPDPTRREASVAQWARALGRLIGADATFLEIGAGDGALAVAMCAKVREVVAIDVAADPAAATQRPPNLKFLLTDGVHIPCQDQTVDLAFSDQLMEHLHPDDALAQLREIYRVLRPGGRYLCVTPHAALGPHDITKFFSDPTPQGLHLREYSFGDLERLYLDVGFSRVSALVGGRGRLARCPAFIARGAEAVYGAWPYSWRRRLRAIRPAHLALSALLGVRLLATK